MGPPAALTPLPRLFYDRDVLVVARDLLGCVVVSGEVVVRLTEVEAYAGPADPASHAFRGPTPRNEVMFGAPGHLYVYFTYGMHHCANLVCGPPGEPAAVLLRAGEVVGGVERVRAVRPAGPDRDLASGPGRLGKALGVDRSANGIDVTRRSSPVWVGAGADVPDEAVRQGPRVGIRLATERPWRFWLDADPTVSGQRPGPRSTTGAGEPEPPRDTPRPGLARGTRPRL